MRPRPAIVAAGALLLLVVGSWAYLLLQYSGSTSASQAATTSRSGSQGATPTPAASASPPPPIQATRGRPQPVALVIGDGYAAGAGLRDTQAGYVPRVGATLGWRMVVRAVSGGGYVAPGATGEGPFSRLVTTRSLHATAPDVVIVQGGLSDIGAPDTEVAGAARSLFHQIRAALPHARVVVVGILWPSTQKPGALSRARAAIRQAAEATPGVDYVDTTQWSFAAAPDGVSPRAAGYAAIGDRLAAALERERVDGQPS